MQFNKKRTFSPEPLPIPPKLAEIPLSLQKFHDDLLNYLRRLQSTLERVSGAAKSVDVITGASVTWNETDAQFELTFDKERIWVLDTQTLTDLQLDFLFYDCDGARP